MEYNDHGMREYWYQVDREGRIFHEGSEIVDPLVLRFFLRAMTQTPDGRFLVLCQDERNWFQPHDSPFVIQRVRFVTADGHVRAAELCFAGDYREPLDPATLESHGGHLFCRVRGGAFRARFGRVAMQQIAPFLIDNGSSPELRVGDHRYPIRQLSRITL